MKHSERNKAEGPGGSCMKHSERNKAEGPGGSCMKHSERNKAEGPGGSCMKHSERNKAEGPGGSCMKHSERNKAEGPGGSCMKHSERNKAEGPGGSCMKHSERNKAEGPGGSCMKHSERNKAEGSGWLHEVLVWSCNDDVCMYMYILPVASDESLTEIIFCGDHEACEHAMQRMGTVCVSYLLVPRFKFPRGYWYTCYTCTEHVMYIYSVSLSLAYPHYILIVRK